MLIVFQCVRTLWIELRAQVSSLDELDMATTRLRLRLPDEPRSDPPVANILERGEVLRIAQHVFWKIVALRYIMLILWHFPMSNSFPDRFCPSFFSLSLKGSNSSLTEHLARMNSTRNKVNCST